MQPYNKLFDMGLASHHQFIATFAKVSSEEGEMVGRTKNF